MNLILLISIYQHYNRLGEFARTVGISPSKLSRIVRGHAAPDEDLKQAIAARLGVSENELFPCQN